MKMKILLVVLLVVVLLGAGVSYAYFATDIFKSDKEIFFSYMQDEDAWPKFLDEDVEKYIEKLSNTPYTNEGELTISSDDEEYEVTFEGTIDVANQAFEEEMTVNLGQGYNIPVTLKGEGDIYGIQSDFLDSNFIAIRNENLKELAERFGLSSDAIPDKIELDDVDFTEEEIKTLKEKYVKVFYENVTDEMFSKTKEDGQTIVTLKMTGEQFTEVFIKILETIKTDELILNKISDEYAENFVEEIDEAISELESADGEEETFEIKLYIESKKVQKCEIIAYTSDTEEYGSVVIENSEDTMVIDIYSEEELQQELTISKNATENDITYNISLEVEDNVDIELKDFSIMLQLKNIDTLDNVEEVVEIDLTTATSSYYYEETNTISVSFSNKVDFSEDLTIENFDEDNSIIINDATDSELQTLILSIYQNLGLM